MRSKNNISFFHYNGHMKKDTLFTSRHFTTFEEMESSALNWHYRKTYKMLPDAYIGTHTIISLPHMQLSYTQKRGGLFQEVIAPKGMFSVGVVKRSDGKACFGKTKLKERMIVFFDDKKAQTIINSDTFEAAVFSFSKQHFKALSKRLSPHIGEVIEDDNDLLKQRLEEVLKGFEADASLPNEHMEEMEQAIIKDLEVLLETQTPYLPKLTKGERIALKILDRVYRRINSKMTIASLAEEFGVTEQTLQNAFKSLFGFTPNFFIRQLKLNHVCQALQKADPKTDTIIRISKKWGFTHMGHFSRYFTELFGENPSLTLGKGCSLPKEADRTA